MFLPDECGLAVPESIFLFMELKGDLPIFSDKALPILANEAEVASVLVVVETKEEALDDSLGLGTTRELDGIFAAGAPLPAMLKWA